MGGQACMLYGAAEFSRDTDLALLASADNFTRSSTVLGELGALVIPVPLFKLDYVKRGHAIHFAYGDRETGRMRIDVMSRMRNVASLLIEAAARFAERARVLSQLRPLLRAELEAFRPAHPS